MGADVLPVPADGSLGGIQQGRDHAHQRRFAGAVGADQPQHARLAAQRELAQRPVLPIALAQVLNLSIPSLFSLSRLYAHEALKALRNRWKVRAASSTSRRLSPQPGSGGERARPDVRHLCSQSVRRPC